jgi:hypothetical protein
MIHVLTIEYNTLNQYYSDFGVPSSVNSFLIVPLFQANLKIQNFDLSVNIKKSRYKMIIRLYLCDELRI